MTQTSLDKKRTALEEVESGLYLPFELWYSHRLFEPYNIDISNRRPIYQTVFATRTYISNPTDVDWEFSPLHARLNVYRCLALVSRTWRVNARDVFLEELEVLTQEALAGLIKMFQYARHLALAVSRIRFSFGEFRCSASTPRRPRALRPDEINVSRASSSGTESGYRSVYNPRPPLDWKVIHRRDAAKYQPSTTGQGRHWARWHADVAQLLVMCTSLSEVTIDSTNRIFRRHSHPRSNRSYADWFPAPDMTNDHIITSLSHSPNLRCLSLLNPTPLEMYGPALTYWEFLKDLSIVLTRDYPELASTEFIPPKSLSSFRFHDKSTGKTPWPLASDLARCTNLQVLDLGVTSLNTTTSMAISFLCASYQHSLRKLVLEVFPGQNNERCTFQGIFESSKLHFSELEYLRLPYASYNTTLFSYFTADKLKYVELGRLTVGPAEGRLEEKWGKGFSYPSLKAVKRFVVGAEDRNVDRKAALMKVCEELGIKLIMGRPSSEWQAVARLDDDEVDNGYEVVAV